VVDFRYHLVSIIAVFLALAVGIVLGTAALNGPIQDELNDNIGRLTSDKRALEGDVEELRGQVSASDEFATRLGPQLVEGQLADQRVLLVTTPNTGDLSERLRPLLIEAGATITGSLEVQPALADPEQRQLLEDLVAEVVPAGLELPDGGPVPRAAAELAAALTTGPGAEPVDAGEAQAVLSAFEEADLVSFRPEAGAQDGITPATMVLMIAPPGSERRPDAAAQQRLEALLEIARAFDDRSRGVVLAGPAQAMLEGGLVRALRASSSAREEISSVDNADRGIGRVAAVLALAEQAREGVGQYGAGPGASEALPPEPGA